MPDKPALAGGPVTPPRLAPRGRSWSARHKNFRVSHIPYPSPVTGTGKPAPASMMMDATRMCEWVVACEGARPLDLVPRDPASGGRARGHILAAITQLFTCQRAVRPGNPAQTPVRPFEAERRMVVSAFVLSTRNDDELTKIFEADPIRLSAGVWPCFPPASSLSAPHP